MSCDVGFSDSDILDFESGWPFLDPYQRDLHGEFFNKQEQYLLVSIQRASSQVLLNEQRTQKPANTLLTKASVGGKAEISVEWGGREGPSVSGSISGNAKDDHGNQVEAKIEIESDGSGKVSASVSHDPDERSR